LIIQGHLVLTKKGQMTSKHRRCTQGAYMRESCSLWSKKACVFFVHRILTLHPWGALVHISLCSQCPANIINPSSLTTSKWRRLQDKKGLMICWISQKYGNFAQTFSPFQKVLLKNHILLVLSCLSKLIEPFFFPNKVVVH
jgi:hypothetical protein